MNKFCLLARATFIQIWLENMQALNIDLTKCISNILYAKNTLKNKQWTENRLQISQAIYFLIEINKRTIIKHYKKY